MIEQDELASAASTVMALADAMMNQTGPKTIGLVVIAFNAADYREGEFTAALTGNCCQTCSEGVVRVLGARLENGSSESTGGSPADPAAAGGAGAVSDPDNDAER